MRRWLPFLPLAILGLIVAGMLWRLATPSDNAVRSRLIGKPLPEFSLAPAVAGGAAVTSASFADGKPRLLNLFASWCLPCIAEAPVLLELQRRGVTIDAIAIRDRQEDVAKFLTRHGNPFQRIGADPESKVQVTLGSAGVPETFVVDGRGIIRFQHIGAIDSGDVPAILRALEEAR